MTKSLAIYCLQRMIMQLYLELEGFKFTYLLGQKLHSKRFSA